MERRRGLTALLGLLLVGSMTLPDLASGQLLVAGSDPADGATGVATAFTWHITFTEPLDSLALIPPGFERFLGVALFPDPGPPDVLRLVEGGMTAEVSWTLMPDTRYVGLVSGARSTGGHPLERPYAITFTTGASLPAGTVSGTVTVTDGSVEGVVVNLIDVVRTPGEPPAALPGPAAAAVVTDPDGAFTLRYVPEGTYVVAAEQDKDLDGNLRNLFEDPFAFFDADGDHVADLVDLTGGTGRAGVDVVIGPVPVKTPAPAGAIVADLIQRSTPGVTLTGVNGAVLTDGKGPLWFWTWQSPTANLGRLVVEAGDQYALFDIPPAAEALPVPDHWVNSDRAVRIANLMGGLDFVADHPRTRITAGLATLAHPPVGGSPELWSVQYTDPESGASFSVLVDAHSGAPVGGPSLTPALFNADPARTAASGWAADARLVSVSAAPGIGVEADGDAVFWDYGFYAPSKAAGRVVTMLGGTVLREDTLSTAALPSLDDLPEGWIDSAEALSLAEGQSSGFRALHPDAVVEAVLTRGLFPADPDRALWRITYTSEADGMSLVVDVDALGGGIVTGVEASEVPLTPVLAQNYPNPFNPRTRIRYALPQGGAVHLVVYNVLGQAVKTLVNDTQPAGTYEVEWDGTGEDGRAVASGLYVYTLRIGGQVLSRAMTFQK